MREIGKFDPLVKICKCSIQQKLPRNVVVMAFCIFNRILQLFSCFFVDEILTCLSISDHPFLPVSSLHDLAHIKPKSRLHSTTKTFCLSLMIAKIIMSKRPRRKWRSVGHARRPSSKKLLKQPMWAWAVMEKVPQVKLDKAVHKCEEDSIFYQEQMGRET